MENATTLQFASAARALADEARRLGLVAPGFRSPPRLADADRTMRRQPAGRTTVAVRVRGRPWPAVLADLIEGVVVVNGLSGPPADRLRARLWDVSGSAPSPSVIVARPARVA